MMWVSEERDIIKKIVKSFVDTVIFDLGLGG